MIYFLRFRSMVWVVIAASLLAGVASVPAQIPGQFAQDFVAGRVPSDEEMTKLEKEVAAQPNDFYLTRKLGKGYFFQFFGEGRASARSNSQKLLERALEMKKEDGETLAYLAALFSLDYARSKDSKQRDGAGKQALELITRARAAEPTHGAVLAIASAIYIWLDDSFKTAPLAAEIVEKTRAAMGPMFSRMSHHGQQRLLLTQGQAYARMGMPEKGRACFEEALKVDQESVEATLIKAEMAKLQKNP